MNSCLVLLLYILSNPEWQFVGIFADNIISLNGKQTNIEVNKTRSKQMKKVLSSEVLTENTIHLVRHFRPETLIYKVVIY